MESLKTVERTDDQVFDKIYQGLVETHVRIFNEDLRAWKTVAENGKTKSSISSHLEKARST